jgi:hypothetical protein
MIRANVRARLDRNDAELALRLVAAGSREEYELAERQLRDRGIDALLDDPRLLPALMSRQQGINASLSLFTYASVRSSLREMGENDALLADYLAAVVLHFGLRDRSRRISATDDQTYATAADIAADLDDPDRARSFLSRAHLGNYALWLSGLFPDSIEHRRRRRGGPDIEYYEEIGSTGFRLAAEHRLAAEYKLAGVLAKAAERFVLLRVALNRISDAMLFPTSHSADRLMRQVRDGSRWRFSN